MNRERKGFLLSRTDVVDPQERLVFVRVLADAPRFDGHFPGHPVLPAVAQLCDLVLPEIALAWPDLAPLSSSPRMKFSRIISPGEELTLRLSRSATDAEVKFELRHADGPCASGALRFDARA